MTGSTLGAKLTEACRQHRLIETLEPCDIPADAPTAYAIQHDEAPRESDARIGAWKIGAPIIHPGRPADCSCRTWQSGGRSARTYCPGSSITVLAHGTDGRARSGPSRRGLIRGAAMLHGSIDRVGELELVLA